VRKTKPDWIHARVPGEMMKPLKELLKRGYKKTDLAMSGVRSACEQEGIEVPA